GETVALQVVHIDGRANTDASHTPWTVTADAAGAFQTTWAVNSVDAAGSTLEVTAVGQSSQTMADAIFTDSTHPPVQRPFWIFGHNPNTVAITEKYINMGVNALEPDVEYFDQSYMDQIDKDRTAVGLNALHLQPGFYIAHQHSIIPGSNFNFNASLD